MDVHRRPWLSLGVAAAVAARRAVLPIAGAAGAASFDPVGVLEALRPVCPSTAPPPRVANHKDEGGGTDDEHDGPQRHDLTEDAADDKGDEHGDRDGVGGHGAAQPLASTLRCRRATRRSWNMRPTPGIATSNAPATAANSIATASGMWPSKPRNDTFTRWPFCRMKISNRMSTSANRIAAAQVRPVRVDRTTCCVAGGSTSSVAGGRGSCERLVAMPIPYPGSRPGMAGPGGAATGPADQGRARPT